MVDGWTEAIVGPISDRLQVPACFRIAQSSRRLASAMAKKPKPQESNKKQRKRQRSESDEVEEESFEVEAIIVVDAKRVLLINKLLFQVNHFLQNAWCRGTLARAG